VESAKTACERVLLAVCGVICCLFASFSVSVYPDCSQKSGVCTSGTVAPRGRCWATAGPGRTQSA